METKKRGLAKQIGYALPIALIVVLLATAILAMAFYGKEVETHLLSALTEAANRPWLVYGIVFVAMYASSFGLPVPEEVTLLTVGFIAFMARHPDLYPGTLEAGEGIRLTTAALVCFVAVLSSDVIVYSLGRYCGPRILRTHYVARILTEERMYQVRKWTSRYGAWAAGAFRFMPGIRFPGHLACGLLHVPFQKFIAVDGMAALISVPTQVFLVGHFGKEIIHLIKTYQPWIVAALVLGVLIHFRGKIAAFVAELRHKDK
ncbi:MAG: SNARE associated Golgi protein [Betaproteobacteria bacterium ADurb.Bin341]|nr:MAG: SNARE associated Golgi protein [Betaproteobacteria bacterium ADurb.Bin341]